MEPRQRLRRADPHRGRHPVNIRPLARYLRPPRARGHKSCPSMAGIYSLDNIDRYYAPFMEDARLVLRTTRSVAGQCETTVFSIEDPTMRMEVADRWVNFIQWTIMIHRDQNTHAMTRGPKRLPATPPSACKAVHAGICTTLARVRRMRSELRVRADPRGGQATTMHFNLSACTWQRGGYVTRLIQWWHTRPGHFFDRRAVRDPRLTWGFLSPAGNLLAWCRLCEDLADMNTNTKREVYIVSYEVVQGLAGKGVGRAACNQLVQRCKSVGVKRVILHPVHEVTGFWTKMGFSSHRGHRHMTLDLD